MKFPYYAKKRKGISGRGRKNGDKPMKKFAILVLALVMCLAAVSAMAEKVTDFPALKAKMAAGGNVELGGNFTAPKVNGLLEVPAGKTVVLDLNGHSITAESGRGFIISVKEGGTLTINATGGGSIKNEYGYAIVNYGTLVVNGGTFTGDYALYNGTYDSNKATATLNGGTFNGIDGGYSIANCANMTIAGATVKDWLSTSGKFKMNGGKVENFVAVTADKSVASGISTEISGGSISYMEVATEDNVKEYNPVTITGGTIAELEVTAPNGKKENTVNIVGGVVDGVNYTAQEVVYWDAPATGDTENLMMWVALMAMAAMGLVATRKMSRQ